MKATGRALNRVIGRRLRAARSARGLSNEARLLAVFRAADAEGRRRVLAVAVSGAGCGSAASDSG